MIYKTKKVTGFSGGSKNRKFAGHMIGLNKRKSHSAKKVWKVFFSTILWIIGLVFVVFSIWFKINITNKLPDVTGIKDMIFAEASVITDRHWEVLYKLFHENREYVELETISEDMINAIVAIEDKRYREHSGLDPIGIIRAAIKNVANPGQGGGASTIPQQLLKNLLLNKDLKKETMKQKVERKMKEFMLTSKLEDSLEASIKKEQGKISKNDLHKKMKEETLELYLNYIWFGNNAYWIEAASKTYFGVESSELDVLQSSILASLPKWPSLFNPYRNKALLMGEVIVKDTDGNKVILWTGDVKDTINEKIEDIVDKAEIAHKTDNNELIKFVKWFISFDVYDGAKKYHVEYDYGRKDLVLTRMFEDGYIDADQFKQAFLWGIDYEFKKHSFPIKAPHFVNWVIEELEKEYDKETLLNWWLTIKTTLDYEIQQIAEEAIKNNEDALEYYGANNNSMVYLDSENWDILAYVGSVDFFDQEIEWQNDMVRALRQPWSTMKPLIYAIAFEKLPLTLDTPIFDIPAEIWEDKPNNADGKFMGILPLRKALSYSRNIPAAKTILALWWEKVAKPYLISLWLETILEDHEYGYPLALWAGEVKMLDLANAYAHLSAGGKPAKIDPILEIRSTDDSILYQKEVEYQEEVIKPWIAYLIWSALSNPSNIPPGWVAKYLINDLKYGVKSGTSNMKVEWDKDRARDGWLVSYIPSKVLVLWWGNTNGSAMYKHAYGGFLNADAMTEFWRNLVKNNYVENTDMPKVETTKVSISKLSGKLASENTPEEFKISTLAYINNPPKDYDEWAEVVEYDDLCNKRVSSYTPIDNIKKWYIINPTTFMPDKMDLDEITNWWNQSTNLSGAEPDEDGLIFVEDEEGRIVRYNYQNVFLSMPEEYCEDRIPKEDDTMEIEILKPEVWHKVSPKFSIWYRINAQRDIKKIIVYVNDAELTSFDYNGTKNVITDIQEIKLPDSIKDGDYNLKLSVIDTEWYYNEEDISIEVVSKDDDAPELLTNKVKIKQLSDGNYEIVLLFEDELSAVNWWSVIYEGEIISEFEWNLVTFQMEELDTVLVNVSDSYGNELSRDVNLPKYK